ncbi:gametogenetin [Notechis scutatus]|uniref:Gametogenetin n=1 Tax=Notechis scutatus TaxID=8663 RepID=A0A6J1VUG9_9SAUR|nr:gametogenetin [Notechis scutatus]
MGNVQSEATQESESVKDRVEKTHPDTTKSERESNRSKHDLASRPPGPPVPEHKGVSQTLSGEPGGGDRQTGTAEMGKNHSKKSKLKLSSMWTQNSVSGGMKEASLCDKDLGTEKWGLSCLSRADLPSGQGLPEDPKGLKMALRPSPPAAPHSEPQDLSAKKALTRGKAKAENVHLAKSTGGMLLQPAKITETSQGGEPPKVETQACWTQHMKTSSKEGAENEEQLPEPPASAKKPVGGATHGPELLKTGEDNLGGPGCRPLNEKNIFRPAPPGSITPSGLKKVPLSWGIGQKEKEQNRQPDSAPGSEGDFRGPAGAAQLSTDWENPSNSPTEKLQAPPGSHTKAEANTEAAGPEAVNYESIYQEFLDKGVNLFYRVTIQPGQWPPSIVKQKPSVISSGISYADVLKQCPQKKPPASPVPILPKALQHLSPAGKKLPYFKGPERNNTDEFSPLRQLFLEHIKKVTPKESGPATPTQQVVTFFEELSTSNPKRAEWQRPRPPTPYPQRRKSQGRKLPKFGTAVSQVVAFLSSDTKCDWLAHDESEMLLDEAPGGGEEAAANCIDLPSPGGKGAEVGTTSQPATTLLLEQTMGLEVNGSPKRSCRKSQDLEEGTKERSPVKGLSSSAAQYPIAPLVDDPSPVQFVTPSQPSSQETLEVSSIYLWAPACALLEPTADPKVPAATQTRPKVRKQSLAVPKSKEKLKPSGQQKGKLLKGKGAKQWPRTFGMNSQLRLDGVPPFPPFEKVARPFYFGEPLDRSLPLDKPASLEQDASYTQPSADRDPEANRSRAHHWPAFQVADSCPRRCYCRHQDQRKLPKNVLAWLNPSANHLTEPPWVATALLAVSLVAGTKFCLDSYKQQHMANED